MEWRDFIYLAMYALAIFDIVKMSKELKKTKEQNKILIDENIRLNNKLNADAE